MLANSVRLALPRMTAPAARSRATSVASRLARASARASEPAVVCCLVAGRDVVLEEDRNAGERPLPARLHAIERGRDGERVGVDLAHRVEPRPGPVIGLDPRQIGAGRARSHWSAPRPAPPATRRSSRCRRAFPSASARSIGVIASPKRPWNRQFRLPALLTCHAEKIACFRDRTGSRLLGQRVQPSVPIRQAAQLSTAAPGTSRGSARRSRTRRPGAR